MSPDRVREFVARQRAIEDSSVPPRLHDQPSLGDVVAFVMSISVLAYALLDTVIGVFVK